MAGGGRAVKAEGGGGAHLNAASGNTVVDGGASAHSAAERDNVLGAQAAERVVHRIAGPADSLHMADALFLITRNVYLFFRMLFSVVILLLKYLF